MNTNSAAEFGKKFRVVELKTSRFSNAIGSNLYAEDRVEYFSVYVIIIIIITMIQLAQCWFPALAN